ncbi:MAG: hypothetical protein SH817_16590 [Leptospira sp.]|nr:hypothetical protein [Leptospira sp.]
MKNLLSILLILIFSLSCKKDDNEKNEALLWALFASLSQNISFKLDETNASPTSQRGITAQQRAILPSKFQDALPTEIIPIKDFSIDIVKLFLWKSPSNGGVPSGSETKDNADKVILDIGKEVLGERMAGKSSLSFFQGPLIGNEAMIAVTNSDNVTKILSVDQSWKDTTFDRMGIEFSSITYLLKNEKLSSPKDALVTLNTILIDSNSYSDGSSTAEQIQMINNEGTALIKLTPVDSILSYTASGISIEDKPCQFVSYANAYMKNEMTSDRQKLSCGTFQGRLPIQKQSGSVTHPGSNDTVVFPSLTNAPTFNETELSQFRSSRTRPLPFMKDTLKESLAKWEIREDSPEYKSNIWAQNRIIVLNLPANRSKAEIKIDSSIGMVFQTQTSGGKFEPNEVPKLVTSFSSGTNRDWSNATLSLDSIWRATYGEDYSTWSYAPKNGNQPDPANGRDFGYFLPKFSVSSE